MATRSRKAPPNGATSSTAEPTDSAKKKLEKLQSQWRVRQTKRRRSISYVLRKQLTQFAVNMRKREHQTLLPPERRNDIYQNLLYLYCDAIKCQFQKLVYVGSVTSEREWGFVQVVLSPSTVVAEFRVEFEKKEIVLIALKLTKPASLYWVTVPFNGELPNVCNLCLDMDPFLEDPDANALYDLGKFRECCLEWLGSIAPELDRLVEKYGSEFSVDWEKHPQFNLPKLMRQWVEKARTTKEVPPGAQVRRIGSIRDIVGA